MRKPAPASERARAADDARVAVFRDALGGLIDALDATVRVARCTGAEGVPAPLATVAAQLPARLGTANRLARSRFLGSIADAARVEAITAAVRRLDAAYVAYCQGRDRDLAAATLDAEIVAIRSAV
jgi:hypothetical protein